MQKDAGRIRQNRYICLQQVTGTKSVTGNRVNCDQKKISRSKKQPEVIVENELILLWCLKAIEGRATTMIKIAGATGIKLNTLRGCYRRLKEKGFIANKSSLKNINGQVGIVPRLTGRPFILRGDMERVQKMVSGLRFDDLPIVDGRINHQIPELASEPPELSASSEAADGPESKRPGPRSDDFNLSDYLPQERLVQNISNLESEVKKLTSELVGLRASLKEKESECRNLEKALKEGEQQLNLVLTGASLGMWDWNIKTGEMVVNDQWAEMLGYTRDNIKSDVSSWENLVHPEDKPLVFEQLKKHLEKGQASGEYKTEHRLRTRDNDYKWVLDFSKIVDWDKDGNPLRMRGTHLDITRIKKLQNQLLRSEKLATAGKLAASITREVNSPLQAVSIVLHTMKSKFGTDPKLMEYIDLVREAYENIRRTMGYLSDITRTGFDNKETVNINQLLEESLSLVKSSLKKNEIKVSLSLVSSLPEVFVSRKGLSQVFLNHINSAVEALIHMPGSPEGGRGGETRTRELVIETAFEDGKILIRIADSGPGVPEKELDQVFDPFYTRNKSMGIGIGLATCLEIVENHMGTITAGNRAGGGVVFTVALPVGTGKSEPAGGTE